MTLLSGGLSHIPCESIFFSNNTVGLAAAPEHINGASSCKTLTFTVFGPKLPTSCLKRKSVKKKMENNFFNNYCMISVGNEVCYAHTNTWFHFCLKITTKKIPFSWNPLNLKRKTNYAYNARLISLILMPAKITKNIKYKNPRRM